MNFCSILRASLAETILDQIGDAVIYADARGTIMRWNHAAAARWHGFEAAMTNGVMKLQGRPTLTRATHKTGRKLYVEMTFALVERQAGGSERGAVAVARDVTERIEQQKSRARRESPEGA